MKPLALLALACLVAPAAAQAQGAKPPFASKEEFRACYVEGEKLKADQAALLAKGNAHNARLKQHQEESQAHFETQAQLDTNDEKAVAAFNLKVEDLNSRVDVINRDAEALNKTKDDLNARSTSLNKRCAGMVVRHTDREAVLKELAATKKP